MGAVQLQAETPEVSAPLRGHGIAFRGDKTSVISYGLMLTVKLIVPIFRRYLKFHNSAYAAFIKFMILLYKLSMRRGVLRF